MLTSVLHLILKGAGSKDSTTSLHKLGAAQV